MLVVTEKAVAQEQRPSVFSQSLFGDLRFEALAARLLGLWQPAENPTI